MKEMIPLRVGIGYDVHRLEAGLALWLGGLRIPHDRGAVGHSDADVLIHALCDALLGALALGDIGTHFPDSAPAYEGISSKKLLARVMEKVETAGYEVANADATIGLEAPRLNPYIPRMRTILAPLLKIPCSRLSIKATTGEGLGFVGEQQGLCCHAVVLLLAREAP